VRILFPNSVPQGRLNFRPVQIGQRLGSATTVYGTVALSFVIPSEAEGSAVSRTYPGNAEYYTQTKLSSRPESHGPAATQGSEKRLGPASTLYGTVTLSLSSRPERSGAEGPAVPQTLRGDVFRPERTRISCYAAIETTAYAAFCKESHMTLVLGWI
jgi:hypothetical protein